MLMSSETSPYIYITIYIYMFIFFLQMVVLLVPKQSSRSSHGAPAPQLQALNQLQGLCQAEEYAATLEPLHLWPLVGGHGLISAIQHVSTTIPEDNMDDTVKHPPPEIC